MVDAFEDAEKTHRIEGTDDLLMSVILDQAADLEHGWREAIQNGIDSPGSSLVTLEFDAESTVVQDDGEGVDLTAERGINLLTNLGESSKKDDEESIGEFGIGKGQIVAKGVTRMKSGTEMLIFDVKNHGLEVAQKTLDDPVDGLRVEVDHYDDEVPNSSSYKWDRYEDRVTDRFSFTELGTGVEVQVNGETVSNGDPEEVAEDYTYSTYEVYNGENTGPVHIAVGMSASDTLTVYSKGVKVKDVESRGLGGVIVTERNLSLNFARNDIKSGCPIWNEVTQRLDEIRQELFEDAPDRRLTDAARKYLADTILRGVENDDFDAFTRFKDKRVFRTASESHVSLEQIGEKKHVGVGEPNDPAADKLNEAYGMMTLDSTDDAVQKFRSLTNELAAQMSVPEEFDPREKAEELGMFTEQSYIPEDELSPNREKRLAVARTIAQRMGIDRQIHYGESDLYNAWTDGHSEIVITDSAMPSSNRLAWMPELFETLVHEYAHNDSTMNGCPDHGRYFDQNYREYMESMWPDFSDFMAEAARTSVKQIAQESRE